MPDFGPWLNELGISNINSDLLRMAFTHRSYKGMGYIGEDNERFEFLGDAVLDLISAEILFKDKGLSESEMTELRKKYVNNAQLAFVFNKLKMEPFIRIANNLKLTNKMKAGFFEAFFGVLFIEKGYSVSYQVWQRIQERIYIIEDGSYQPNWDRWSDYQLKNSKSTLQEFCQSHQFGIPEYTVVSRRGPDHDPNYKVKVIILPGSNRSDYAKLFNNNENDNHYNSEYGVGKNIKLAEKRAAEKMCDRIGLSYSSEMYE